MVAGFVTGLSACGKETPQPLPGVAVKELTLSYHNSKTILFIYIYIHVYPYCGNLN